LALPSYWFQIHFNIIFPIMHKFSTRPVSFGFLLQKQFFIHLTFYLEIALNVQPM
jgi:hypothetical protein